MQQGSPYPQTAMAIKPMQEETLSADGGSTELDGAGWLPGAQYHPSPNCDQRPIDTPIDLLVIHNISLPPGEFGGDWIDDFFLNRLDPKAHPYFTTIAAVCVSAHLLIGRDGRLIQYVPCELRAWHAGTSSFMGRERCNDYSIGIELEGTDTAPYTAEQYQTLADCTRWLRGRYPGITPERIAGHSDIAPGRKTDPGPAFDWGRYLDLAFRATEQPLPLERSE
jgi:N-acetyl-anhydromuramoyl-L-alanine amidase